MRYERQIERGYYEAFTLAPRDWVPNNSKLAVAIYRTAIPGAGGDLAAEFEALFEHNQWPPQWRDGIFDYHHFHSTAHSSWDDAVSEYETLMFARVIESAEASAEGAATFLSHDAEALTIEMYRRHRTESGVLTGGS